MLPYRYRRGSIAFPVEGFGHEDEQDRKGGSCHGSQEQKPRSVTEVMNDGSGNRLTESRADTHRRCDRAQREIKPPGATRQIGYHEDGNDPENAGADAVEHLDANQRVEVVGEGVKDAANG